MSKRKRPREHAADDEYVADSANADDFSDPDNYGGADGTGNLEGGFDQDAAAPKASLPGSGIEQQWRGKAMSTRAALAAGHPVCAPPVTGDLAHAIAIHTGEAAYLEQKPTSPGLRPAPGETLTAHGSMSLVGNTQAGAELRPAQVTVQRLDLRAPASPVPYYAPPPTGSAAAQAAAQQSSNARSNSSDGSPAPGRPVAVASIPGVGLAQAGNVPRGNAYSQFTVRAPGER
jgi:hypothetical protein